ncbi:MAG: amidohydrolase family protein [Sphingomonas sp.]
MTTKRNRDGDRRRADAPGPAIRRAFAATISATALVSLAATILPATTPAGATQTPRMLALIGATLIDASAAGHGSADIARSIVLIRDGRIVAAGDAAHVRIPRAARRVRLDGRYLIPGLIDGFGAMRTPGFAQAYLREGVTTVYVPLASPDGNVDGETKMVAAPAGPSVLTGVAIGGYDVSGKAVAAHQWVAHRLNDQRLDAAALVAAVERAAAAGRHGITIGPDVWPDQTEAIAAAAHRLGLFVAAEPVFTPYDDAVRAGVDVLLRNDKYQLSLAAAADWQAYRDDPTGGGGRDAMRAICGKEDIAASITAFGARLAASTTALMPVLVMEATADDIGGPNPWTLPGARYVTKADLDDPVDPVTGARPYLTSHPDRAEAIRACARSKAANDGRLHRAGARYLAGTLTPGFGVMPGSGLHVELRLLQKIGLSPREALAAATGNYATLPGWRDRGLIATGRRADLVVLRADPRRDIAAIDTIDRVMIGGRFAPR